jgi:hypothetical protein
MTISVHGPEAIKAFEAKIRFVFLANACPTIEMSQSISLVVLQTWWM